MLEDEPDVSESDHSIVAVDSMDINTLTWLHEDILKKRLQVLYY